jgi:rsbT co-antagonist protein RsbR
MIKMGERKMKNNLQLLGEKILKDKYEIAQLVHNDRMAQVTMTPEENRQFKEIEQHIIDIRANFVGLFGEALVDHLDIPKNEEKIHLWGVETGSYFYQLGVPLDEALKDTGYYRKYIWQNIRKEAETQKMSTDTIFDAITIIAPLLDQAAYSFSLTYTTSFKETLKKAQKDFLELSVPVVPLTKGVAILPLIGKVDTDRANVIMEETLSNAVRLKLGKIIIDLSGILIVDTIVANQLFRIIDALRLIGVCTVITGIRPEIAKLIVSNGIDFSNINIKANLHQAMQDIYISVDKKLKIE